MTSIGSILLCRCACTELTEPRKAAKVAAILRAAGREVREVADLCALVERRDRTLTELGEQPSPVIIACRPRAVRALFDFAGINLPAEALLIDLRNKSAEEALREILQPDELSEALGKAAEPESLPTKMTPDEDWLPWFPAIDYSRCTNCGRCLSFCLFGVYETNDAGRVTVASPRNCKSYCPACARVCPVGAIIFAKHPEPPVDGGEPNTPSEAQDAPTLVQQDVFEALKQRNRRHRTGGCECGKPSECDSSADELPADLSPEEIAEVSRRLREHAWDNEKREKR